MVADHLFYIPLWWLLLPPPWLTAATGVLATGAQSWERAVSARNKTARGANVSTGFHPGNLQFRVKKYMNTPGGC